MNKVKYKDMLIEPNRYSRPMTKQMTIQKIVVHWVGNAGTTAENNAKYFDSLKAGKKNSIGEFIYASSHYIIGNDGVLVRCVPEGEVAYHASKANNHSIGIEMCHPDWNGKFTNLAYNTLIELLAELCTKYRLNPTEDIIRHYDVTGKDCPRYYVQNVKEWNKLKEDVESKLTVDAELEKAVSKMVHHKIISSPEAWKNVRVINLKYVDQLICNIGKVMYKVTGYTEAINELVKAGVIGSPELWNKKTYTSNNVRSLIIKVSSKLS